MHKVRCSECGDVSLEAIDTSEFILGPDGVYYAEDYLCQGCYEEDMRHITRDWEER